MFQNLVDGLDLDGVKLLPTHRPNGLLHSGMQEGEGRAAHQSLKLARSSSLSGVGGTPRAISSSTESGLSAGLTRTLSRKSLPLPSRILFEHVQQPNKGADHIAGRFVVFGAQGLAGLLQNGHESFVRDDVLPSVFRKHEHGGCSAATRTGLPA